MIDLEQKSINESMKREYDALNKTVGQMLLIENTTQQQEDDLAYYTRKLTELRQNLKRRK